MVSVAVQFLYGSLGVQGLTCWADCRQETTLFSASRPNLEPTQATV